MARVRVRGTKEQVQQIIGWLDRRGDERKPRFTVSMGVSGAYGGEDSRQWGCHFYIAQDLVDELRTFLAAIRLEEEI